MTKKDLAIEAIRRVHRNTTGTLEDTLDDLETLRELADELISAIQADIEMQQ